MKERYVYGLKLRPSGALCQPPDEERVMSYIKKGRYWSLVAYDHMLTNEECDHYDMELSGVERVKS